MSYTIIYKTYENDLEWLKYSFRSLLKYVLPFNTIEKVLIYSHDICFGKVAEISTILKGINVQILPVHYDYHGYIKQMVVKACVFNDVHTDYVIYIDSDCIFTANYNFSTLINNDGKPYWYILNDVNNEGIIVWKEVVKNMTFNDMKYYYMYNAFPFIIKTSTLKLSYDKFIETHKKTYGEYAKEKLEHFGISVDDSIVQNFDKLSKVFTEFEYIGYIAHNFTDDYEFVVNARDKQNLKQFWSHGGINEDIKRELDELF